jgi:signal transduction histidine kinase
VILDRITALLDDPRGSLAYHLIATFTIGLIFLLAQAHRRQIGPAALRWTIASGPLAAARLGLLLLAASTAVTAPELAAMLSPLERYLAVAGGLALAWVFLFPLPDRIGDLGFGAALAVCSMGLAVSAIPLALSAGEGVSAVLASGWDVAGLIAMLASAAVLGLRRPLAWPAAAGALALLGLGFGLQLVAGSTSSPAPLRFAELLAYPALSAAAAWKLAAPTPAPWLSSAPSEPPRPPELMPERTLKGLQAAASVDGPPAPLKGSEDSEQVAQLKAEFRLALQELAELSLERRQAASGDSAQEGLALPMVGSLGDVVQGMRRSLTSALSRAELLNAEAADRIEAGQQELLAKVREDVLQLTALVDKLGELTSESAAQAVSGTAETDLPACLRSVLDQMAGTIEEKKLTFSMSLPEDLPRVRARQGDLEQLLAMMLESAVASTFPGTQVQIRGAAERTPSATLVSLSVTDSGQGFPPEEVAQAFQPWHQLDGSSSGGTRALGISLAGLRKKAELLGGRVWVASELGAGTTITVLLPAVPSKPIRA